VPLNFASVVDHADQALMKNVIALRLRLPVPRHESVWIDRDGVSAGIGHLVVDREHVFVVDRDGADEFEPLAVVVGEDHRRLWRERTLALRVPQRATRGKREILVA
jgi:hypothetical protein